MSMIPLFPLWSVTDLTRYLKDLLESDANLRDVWVQGEVSNFKIASSGHAYFTLKDGNAQLPCVMWKPHVQRQAKYFLPQDGDAIEAHGHISVYAFGGRYQFYTDILRPGGEGNLYREFQRLKAQLEAEGLFDEARKRPLPPFPHRIGVVTSPTGAALRDILNTLHRRFPLAEVVLAPTLVQGTEAPASIVHALQALNVHAHPDVILLARGGGSIEDLWAFNNETVVRAVAASQAPVITGVGHQTDFTLVDFAADQRAPTPTAAAELATPNKDDLLVVLQALKKRLQRSWEVLLTQKRADLTQLASRLNQYAPQQRLFFQAQRLDEIEHQIQTAWAHILALHRAHLDALNQRLEALNPLAVLRRGYALVTRENGQVIRKADVVQPGEIVHIRVAEGAFQARVQPFQTS